MNMKPKVDLGLVFTFKFHPRAYIVCLVRELGNVSKKKKVWE